MVCNFETIFNYYNDDDMLMQIRLLKDKKKKTRLISIEHLAVKLENMLNIQSQ